ncbi:MAG: type IV secretory system conjugative DNA transfer family protein [Ruminococcus flavefaciens]|nr:type IV secretory system conjugative DNA transfer family protein [Ruminococcus flavefaciens]MCM1380755.1 type IV secretory system conjugative DNA transfer family protein [Muribaculaceae bacterium]MCM1479397.1 type IV secretory system conjugative DNA transfer family protein [Muribaculaceae bacterium]
MQADKIILGENCIFSTDSTATGLNNNVIVCGGSGCGKTMSISEPRLLETYNSSLITTVTKRRIVSKYKPLFIKRGYEVQDLDFVNPLRGNVGYDPLQYVQSFQDITYLAKSIVNSNPRKDRSNADPFWDEAATSLLSAEIAYILMTKADATFADVLYLHDNLKFEEDNEKIKTSLDRQFEKIEAKDPTCFAVTRWRTFHQMPIKTAACIFGSLNAAIDTVFNPELRKIMSMKHKVDFENLSAHKTVLFVTTSPVNPVLSCFVNIFYGHIFKRLFEYAEKLPDGTLPIPVHVLCDDFATGSQILNFPEYISIFREKGISVSLLLQSESQLEAIYGSDSATTIINNCDTYIYMGGMDLKTAQNISLRLNAPLEEVLYMPIGQEIIFRRGQRPIITKRYDITKNEMYRDCQIIPRQAERTSTA